MRSVAFLLAASLVALCHAHPDPSVGVPPAIQKLRAPLTAIPLGTLFENMNNRRTVEFYTNCVIGTVTCDRVGNALRNLVSDVMPGRDICYGCTSCERERVQYAMDMLFNNYKDLACQVQTHFKRPVFGGANPCS